MAQQKNYENTTLCTHIYNIYFMHGKKSKQGERHKANIAKQQNTAKLKKRDLSWEYMDTYFTTSPKFQKLCRVG